VLLADSPKYTLVRIIQACIDFGMSEEETLRFFRTLLAAKAPLGRPLKQKPPSPGVEPDSERAQLPPESKPPEAAENSLEALLRLLGVPEPPKK
jgi:hypothetical protein